jgi:hypothetical protein
MRHSDMWGYLTGLAHSLPYDYALSSPGARSPAQSRAHGLSPSTAKTTVSCSRPRPFFHLFGSSSAEQAEATPR